MNEPVVIVSKPFEMVDAKPDAVKLFAPRAIVAFAFIITTAFTVSDAESRVAVNEDAPVSKVIVIEDVGVHPQEIPPDVADQCAD